MAKMHWLISGVGRSGTTMAYSALLSAATAQEPDTLGRYEPFLWGEKTWDKFPQEMGSTFSHTDAISPKGLFAHTQTPLFLDEPNEVFDRFAEDVFPANENVVAKIIRGAGRLNAFLTRDPSLKVIHLVRNPLDVVNSSLQYFSFYGGEFHPSDEPRFNEEAARLFPDHFRSTEGLSDAGKAFEWWHLMNEAAFASAKRFNKRVKIVAYEYLMADTPAVLGEIIEFLGGSRDDLEAWSPEEKVGPITSYLAVKSGDRDALLPHVDAYFSDSRIFNQRKNKIDAKAAQAKLIAKYDAVQAGTAFKLMIDPTLSPTKVRTMANQALVQAESARVAGIEQAKNIASSVAEKTRSDFEALKTRMEAQQAARDDDAARLFESLDTILTLAKERSILENQNESLQKQLASQRATSDRLESDLKAAKVEKERIRQEQARDMDALRQLNASLRDRIKGFQHQQRALEEAAESARADKHKAEEKLKKTEHRLKTVASDKERYRLQLAEMSSALSPRLKTVLTLRPLRYVLNQRQRIKSGQVEIDAEGVVRPKSEAS